MNISTQDNILFNNLNASRSNNIIMDSNGNTYEVVDSNKNNQLGSDAFLKMLLKQMELQDPLSPMNDAEYVGQMTSFSILEQLTSISSKLDSIGDAILQLKSNNNNISGTPSNNNDSEDSLTKSISNTNFISNNSNSTNYILNKLYSNSF